MMRAPRKTIRGAWSMVLGATAAVIALAVPGPALAQQDTTAPVILEFSASPLVFDTGPASVAIEFCARASDDLSGITRIDLWASCATPSAGCEYYSGTIVPAGALNSDACAELVLPRFSKYDSWLLRVWVLDKAGNSRNYVNPGLGSSLGDLNLCDIGPCAVLNRPASTVDDADNDGTPDDADNCPDVTNRDQTDSDVDLIGDACDPFPDDRDNEQAQCEADLGQSKRDGKQTARKLERVKADLAAERADADGDGVPDAVDDCHGTTISAEVDRAGCSIEQFCGRVVATTATGRKACRRSDWKNDEPLMNLLTEADCSVDPGQTTGGGDDRCVAALP